MQTIKDMRKTKIINDYQSFDKETFLKTKTLRVEAVKKDKTRGIECIKMSLRIVKDKDGVTDEKTGEFYPYNEGKLFTYIIYNTQDDIFAGQLEELKEHISHHIEIDMETITETYLYRQNILTIVGDEYTLLEETSQVEEMEFGHRPLAKLSKYKSYDIQRLIEETQPQLSTLYKGKGNHYAMFNAFLNDEDYVVFAVHVDDVEDYPAELLKTNIKFDRDVQSYDFDYITSSGYGTRWVLYFNHITLKSGVLGYEPFRIGKDTNETQSQTMNTSISQSYRPNQI